MVKIFFVLMILPIISISQTAEEYFTKALDYQKKSDYQYQIDNYTKCLQVDPSDYIGAYINRGRAYKLKSYQYYIRTIYTKAIKINPNDAQIYNNRGVAYSMLKNYKLAIDDFTRSIEIDPNYLIVKKGNSIGSNAYNNRGRVYYNLESYENAIADFTRSIEIEPNNATTYRDRGVVKEEIGLNYCSDYKRACDLGNKNCCEWYNDQCR